MVVAAMNGADAVRLLGTIVGGSIVLSVVLRGAWSVADALLLAAINAWKGLVFVVRTAW